jgi:hypothetical protein
MKNLFKWQFCLLAAFATIVSAKSETYFCIAENSVGFRSTANWESINFNTDTSKFIFRSVKTGEKDIFEKPILAPFVTYELGSNVIDREVHGCYPNKRGDLYFCDVFGTSFIFNKERLLFQASDRFGYVLQDDKSMRSDVAITIGKCSKID